MEKLLTIKEIEEMNEVKLEQKMSEKQIEQLNKLGITLNSFLDCLKDSATLSGLEDTAEFITISDYIAHLEQTQNDNNEYIENEFVNQETSLVQTNNSVLGLGNMTNNNIVRPQILTNITDKKMIFNLGKKVDKLLNDCEGQEITIDKVLVKKYQKPLEQPVLDPETGEIIADTKTTMSIVIVDDKGVSYATGSKTFGYSLMNCIFDFGDEIQGLKIRIIKTTRNGNKNKSLDFELV